MKAHWMDVAFLGITIASIVASLALMMQPGAMLP